MEFAVSTCLWKQCIDRLENELSSEELDKWIRPLQAVLYTNTLVIYAPNQFVLNWVKNNYLNNINIFLSALCGTNAPLIRFKIGSKASKIDVPNSAHYQIPSEFGHNKEFISQPRFDYGYSKLSNIPVYRESYSYSNIDIKNNFENFIKGSSNQLAYSVARQVANNLGRIYNPLFIYGKTGLGKTHLLHAVGNDIIKCNKKYKVVYMHSEHFVQHIVNALKNNTIEEFKRYYRSFDALLIDDIQFFANKQRSQEEFLYTFNALLENNQQIILTSNRYPKEICNIEEGLKSRFICGLTVGIGLPEFETRIAILMKKANENKIVLPKDVAFFIAKNLRSNGRELEGALNCVIANANFTGCEITIDCVKEAIRDLLLLEEKLVTLDNIQKTVARYYKVKVSDLLSKRRTRLLARSRQVAMALSKALTKHSMLEISNAFGKRDHTTVVHACYKIKKLCEEDHNMKEDFFNLVRILTS